MDNFNNDKKTFLSKLDKSKKGEIDERIVPIIQLINSKSDYYTTSSCSGRVYLWRGNGKKNQTEWLRVSHSLVDEAFFQIQEKGLIWLRLEDFILHICCRDLGSANKLLLKARKLYKKSCILSASKKIMVEIRGSELLEVPLYEDGQLLFNGELSWLKEEVNSRFNKIWKKEEEFKEIIKNKIK
ncbi:MAG: tRNA wybutosine-synthesizing 3 family protein [Nanoarchaeota archaeon]